MRYFYLTILLFISTMAVSQQRYLDKVHCNTEVINNLQYATQMTYSLAPWPPDTIPLEMDLYLPVEDSVAERPVVVYLHTGNFLPHPVNGVIGGTRKDSSAVKISTELAQRGFVVVNADYRLGWNPLASTQQQRAKSLVRALYRSIQDARTLNRFLRKDYENGNQWGIDTSKMILLGQGTGAYTTYGVCNLDSYEELLIDKFFYEDDDGLPVPMVTEEVDGDIYGTSNGIAGDGTVVTLGQYPGYSSDYHLGICLGGAIVDDSWIDEHSSPMILFQNPEDVIDAYYENNLTIGPDLPILEVQGAYIVAEMLNELGVNDALGGSTMSDPCTEAALAMSDLTYINPYTEEELPINNHFDGLYPFITPDWSNGETNNHPWEWFDPNTNINTPEGLTETIEMIKTQACVYIDTILCYATPRIVHLFDLDTDLTSGLEVSTTVLDFGSVELGNSKELEISISNPYDVAIDFTANAVGPFVVGGETSIPACGTGTLIFTFTPGIEGTFNEEVSLESTSGDIPLSLNGLGNWATGLEEVWVNNINIYPNPSNGQFQIDLGALDRQKMDLQIFDNVGRLALEQKVIEDRITIKGLNAGIYFVSLKTASTNIHKKIVIQ